MEGEGTRLADLAAAVRQSSLKRLRAVSAGQENWRPTGDAMSFADLAQHLIDADRWLFQLLDGRSGDPIVGRPRLREVRARREYDFLLGELESAGAERETRIAGLGAPELARRYFDPRFNREVTVWWGVVRGNLDHEIHHRGQLSVYLRAAGAATWKAQDDGRPS